MAPSLQACWSFLFLSWMILLLPGNWPSQTQSTRMPRSPVQTTAHSIFHGARHLSQKALKVEEPWAQVAMGPDCCLSASRAAGMLPPLFLFSELWIRWQSSYRGMAPARWHCCSPRNPQSLSSLRFSAYGGHSRGRKGEFSGR